ncbi:hypothetical protein C8F01DRAFT_1331569 [Mycena amicta]|nr:hypothetical protein C8F01DRAFT_1331569 [Mycena amicta]
MDGCGLVAKEARPVSGGGIWAGSFESSPMALGSVEEWALSLCWFDELGSVCDQALIGFHTGSDRIKPDFDRVLLGTGSGQKGTTNNVGKLEQHKECGSGKSAKSNRGTLVGIRGRTCIWISLEPASGSAWATRVQKTDCCRDRDCRITEAGKRQTTDCRWDRDALGGSKIRETYKSEAGFGWVLKREGQGRLPGPGWKNPPIGLRTRDKPAIRPRSKRTDWPNTEDRLVSILGLSCGSEMVFARRCGDRGRRVGSKLIQQFHGEATSRHYASSVMPGSFTKDSVKE